MFGVVATSTTLEADINNTHRGGTGVVSWSGTPATAGAIMIGAAAVGPFYGAMGEKADPTSDRANIETYMGALHP